MTYDPHAEVARLQVEVNRLTAKLELAIKLLSDEAAERVHGLEVPVSQPQMPQFWNELLAEHRLGNSLPLGYMVTETYRDLECVMLTVLDPKDPGVTYQASYRYLDSGDYVVTGVEAHRQVEPIYAMGHSTPIGYI